MPSGTRRWKFLRHEPDPRIPTRHCALRRTTLHQGRDVGLAEAAPGYFKSRAEADAREGQIRRDAKALVGSGATDTRGGALSPTTAEVVIRHPSLVGPLLSDSRDEIYERFQDDHGNWYVVNKYDPSDVRPLERNGEQIRGRVLGLGGSRASESPFVRDNRRAADRDYRGLTDTRRGMRDMRRELGPLSTSADSARVLPNLRRLQARADSLQTEYDRHSAAANTGSAGPATPPTAGATPMQRDLVEARQAYEASVANVPLGPQRERAKRLYEQVVDTIRARHAPR